MIFFWDPLEPQPHDPDVKALLRIAVVWNIPVDCNRATADFMISSSLMHDIYDRLMQDYDEYKQPDHRGGFLIDYMHTKYVYLVHADYLG